MPWSIVVWVCASAEKLLEGLPELRAEDGVDDRVERGVKVAEPQEEAQDLLVNTLHAEGCDQSRYEERKPTQDKRPGDNSQRLGGLLLPLRLQGHVFLLLFLFHLLLRGDEESHVLCLAGHIGAPGPAVQVLAAAMTSSDRGWATVHFPAASNIFIRGPRLDRRRLLMMNLKAVRRQLDVIGTVFHGRPGAFWFDHGGSGRAGTGCRLRAEPGLTHQGFH